MIPDGQRWNHNIHYHQLILRSVPDRAGRALDVGCGEGLLARQLRQRVAHVVGIDLDEASISTARQQPAGGIGYVLADLLHAPFEDGSFDFIAAVASLHHVELRSALGRLGGLLRPGGRLAVVGLARSRQPVDLAYDIGGALAHRIMARSRTVWDHAAPTVWPPPLTYGQARRQSQAVLPGAWYRRHLLWRYSLIWDKPGRWSPEGGPPTNR